MFNSDWQAVTSHYPVPDWGHSYSPQGIYGFRRTLAPPSEHSPAVSQTKQARQPIQDEYLMRLLVATPAGFQAADTWTYARQIASLLGGRLNQFRLEKSSRPTLKALTAEAEQGYGLLVLGEPEEPALTRLFRRPLACQVAERTPISTLVARRPRWPLRKILLVIRNAASDDTAVRWVTRLADPARTTVTLLVLHPYGPVLASREMRMQQGLSALTAHDGHLPAAVCRAANRLLNQRIESYLRFRGEPADLQLHHELKDNDYDLTVVAAEPHDWWLRRLLGELVAPLLKMSNRPVLIARPT